jgi:two-component system nitrogen regulation response regulator GlnG
LFGHERGSFTGADQKRIGKFEQCSGGTLFLDEVGDMSLLLQSKVLRLLQEQRFERVGGNQTIQTDVRIVAATHRDLEKMVEEGTFRADLFYRLNGFMIRLPPVRERGSDILLLLQHYLAQLSRDMDKDVHSISPDSLKLLMQYPWPGNVRELQAALRHALLQATGAVIIPEFLPEAIRNDGTDPQTEPSAAPPVGDFRNLIQERLSDGSRNLYAEMLEWMERHLLLRVLRFTDGNQSQAAEILGIARGSLRNKIRTLGISIGQVVDVSEPAGSGKGS